ncbi:hypothetical protein IJG14_08035, partial [bacterium]|nr:hypothetical protein [bacterium]
FEIGVLFTSVRRIAKDSPSCNVELLVTTTFESVLAVDGFKIKNPATRRMIKITTKIIIILLLSINISSLTHY